MLEDSIENSWGDSAAIFFWGRGGFVSLLMVLFGFGIFFIFWLFWALWVWKRWVERGLNIALFEG